MSVRTPARTIEPNRPINFQNYPVILFKFSITDPKFVPWELEEKERLSDAEMDALHQQRAEGDLGQVGRVRVGRVDTGDCVITTRRPTRVDSLEQGLSASGYNLAYLHRFKRMKEDRATFVVCAGFARVKGMSSSHILEELASTIWATVHVWINPDGTLTINCAGRLVGQQPKLALVIREGKLLEEEFK